MQEFRQFGGPRGYPRDFTVRHGATTVSAGALLVRGATAGTNGGMVIVAGAALTDALGPLLEELNSSVTDSTILGTTEQRRKVLVAPFSSLLAEYSQAAADDVDADGGSSSTTLTITNLEDNIDGGFILVANGTNSQKQLRYLTASASGSCTLKSAFGTALATGDGVVKILPRLHQLAVINTAATKLASTDAVGTARCVVVENWIDDPAVGSFRPLDPVRHSPITLSSVGKIYGEIALSNNAFFPLD